MNNSPESTNDRIQTAMELEERHQYELALNCWRELALEQPNAETLCNQARLAEELGLTDEAQQSFERAINTDPQHGWAYVGLASLLLDCDKTEEAVTLLQKAITHEPSPVSYTLLGIAFRRLGRNDEAARSLEAAIQLDPNYEEAYFNLAIIKEKTAPHEAETLYLKALEADPNYVVAHRDLGQLLSGTGPSATAEYHLRRALELDPNEGLARVYLGNLLWTRGDVDEATSEFEKAIPQLPDQALPIWALANVYESQELWNRAEELYERAIQTEPDDEVAHMNFGRMLKKKGDLVRAAVELRHALTLDPHYDAARRILSEMSGA